MYPTYESRNPGDAPACTYSSTMGGVSKGAVRIFLWFHQDGAIDGVQYLPLHQWQYRTRLSTRDGGDTIGDDGIIGQCGPDGIGDDEKKQTMSKEISACRADIVINLTLEVRETNSRLLIQRLENQRCCHYNINCWYWDCTANLLVWNESQISRLLVLIYEYK